MKRLIAIGVILLFMGMTISSSTGLYLEKQSIKPLSSGNILYVGGSGPGNYTKIQHAIIDASDGDTVFVYDDSSPYYENVVVDKSINLIGENKYTTVIDGGMEDNVVSVFADGVVISGFTMENSATLYGISGINIEGNYCIISNNVITHVQWVINLCIGTHNNVISNCTLFVSEGLHNREIGIRVDGSFNNLITRCYFKEFRDAVYLEGEYGDCSNNVISFCKFDNNSEAIYCNRAPSTRIINCTFQGYPGFNLLWMNYECDGSIIKNCKMNKSYTGIVIKDDMKNICIENCEIINSGLNGIEVHGWQYNLRILNCTVENTMYQDGLIFHYPVVNSRISNCQFLNNDENGITFLYKPWFVRVENCHITGNMYGISMFKHNFFNLFYKNTFDNLEDNFKTNEQGSDLLFMVNVYKENYWSDWNGTGPYHVYGLINYDFNPASEPYEIGV